MFQENSYMGTAVSREWPKPCHLVVLMGTDECKNIRLHDNHLAFYVAKAMYVFIPVPLPTLKYCTQYVTIMTSVVILQKNRCVARVAG